MCIRKAAAVASVEAEAVQEAKLAFEGKYVKSVFCCQHQTQ